MPQDKKFDIDEFNAIQRAKLVDAINWVHSGDIMDDLVDLLTNMRLWAQYKGLDFYEALDKSYRHYLNERQGLNKKNGP